MHGVYQTCSSAFNYCYLTNTLGIQYTGMFIVGKYIYMGRPGHDRKVVGFITTYVIRIYHHLLCEFESRPDELYSIQH